MRVEKWDILMHRLLTEKKEKELKEKAFAGKKELDNDEDGVPKWADKDDSDSKVGSKGSKKKKGKGKIPPQLKMHIKKKKSKLDESIERLEKILFEQHDLQEYGEDKHPDIEDDDDDFDDDLPSYDEEDFGDYGEESMRKFAQKSKDFADKYTEEDDYEEEEEEDYEEEEEEEDYEDEEDMEDEEEDFEEEELEESEELDSTEANIEKIDREDYRRETANTDQSVELDELIEALKGTKFESMQCLDPSRYSQVIKFTEGPSDGSFILPMKKTDDYLYFKTNEKSNGVYYKIPLAESEEEDEEYLTEAEVKKKQPRLGKVTRNPSGSKKKFHVYVKCGGRVKKISFGDPGLSIKRDSAARRKNFRARHKCDQPAGKDRCTARYWSCYQWRAGKKVEGEE